MLPTPFERLPTLPRWRRGLPWAAAAAIVAYLVHRVDVTQVGELLARVNPVTYLAFIFALSGVNLACDCLATSRVYKAIGAQESVRTVLVVRAASYLPAILNYHLGQAYLTYLVAKRHRRSVLDVARGTLVGYITTFGAWVAVGAPSLLLDPRRASWATRTIAILVTGGVAYLTLLAARPRALAGRPALRPLFDVGVRGNLALLAWRLPHALVLGAGFWTNYAFFGVRLPLLEGLARIPLILLFSSLPITPQGMGTRELIAIELLAPFVVAAHGGDRNAAVIAAGAAWTLGTLVASATIGLAFMRRAQTILFDARSSATSE